MFREHARLLSTLQFIADIFLTGIAFRLAYATRLHIDALLPENVDRLLNPELHPAGFYVWMIALGAIWWAVTASSLGLYRLSTRRLGWGKFRIIFESSILLGLFLGFLSFALKLELSRPLIALFVFYQAVLLSVARIVVQLYSRSRGRHPDSSRNLLIAGYGVKAREMGDLISRYSDWGLKILGYVDTNGNETSGRESGYLGTVSDIPRIVENNVVDEIIFVGNKTRDLDTLDEVLALCAEQGIRTRVAVDFFPSKVSNVSMEFLEGVPILTFSRTPDHPVGLFVKRAMDVFLALLLLLGLLPLMAVIALLIKLTSRGPVIYRQTRCGLYGRKFVLYKFRSMREGAEDILWEIKHLNEMDGPVFKMRNDPRVTPLGRILRKTSIDEWPQFWNVLKGDMSLVGPRAPLPEEVKEYTRWQRRRLSVKPGITCLWQVSGRNEIDFYEWMKLDLHYIDNWSLLLDLKILLRTFPVVILGKGAR